MQRIRMKAPAKYEHIESDRQARKMPITFGGTQQFLDGRPRVWRFTNVCPRMYVIVSGRGVERRWFGWHWKCNHHKILCTNWQAAPPHEASVHRPTPRPVHHVVNTHLEPTSCPRQMSHCITFAIFFCHIRHHVGRKL